jgi:hypothetical protein
MKLNKNYTFGILFFLSILFSSFDYSTTLYQTKSGKVSFKSEAPLELIKASSEKLAGILDAGKKSFAFLVPMSSFNGFGKPLQKDHFNENYIESDKYPNAKFEGKIIEDIDFGKDGTYNVRAKGKFSVHGVEVSKTIKCKMVIKGNEIKVTSSFKVTLQEHGIRIPSVVNQKIAEEITVSINSSLSPR